MTSIVDSRNAVLLGRLEDIFISLGYEGTQFVPQSKTLPFPTLLLPLAADAHDRPRFMTLMIYPAVEFEDTILLQYYTDLPFVVPAEHLQAVTAFLPLLNHKAVVGYFGLTGGGEKPYYRYVQALRAAEPVSPAHVADVATLVTATPDIFQAILEAVATGRTTPVQARAQVDALYARFQQ